MPSIITSKWLCVRDMTSVRAFSVSAVKYLEKADFDVEREPLVIVLPDWVCSAMSWWRLVSKFATR